MERPPWRQVFDRTLSRTNIAEGNPFHPWLNLFPGLLALRLSNLSIAHRAPSTQCFLHDQPRPGAGCSLPLTLSLVFRKQHRSHAHVAWVILWVFGLLLPPFFPSF